MCGNLINPPVRIPTDKNSLRLLFRTDGANQFKGFHAAYHFEKVSPSAEEHQDSITKV